MANYLVGDLQGELRPLQLLLEYAGFDETRDILWAAGDLVNRGAQSLEVLRFFYQHQACTRVVLGNHDMHLLVIAAGIRTQNTGDTLDAVLKAPDRNALLDWLRQQPLVRRLGKDVLVHAGIPPQWDIESAIQFAREVGSALSAPNYHEFLKHLYGDEPDRWDAKLEGIPRLRLICNYLTRMRFCAADGTLMLSASGDRHSAPANTLPWFAHPHNRDTKTRIFFGHWGALREHHPAPNIYALDGGWIWGGQLRLLKLEGLRLFECERSDESIHVQTL